MTKKATPRKKVKRVINNSPPRSFRLLNKSLLLPLIIFVALSAFPLCNNTMAISQSIILAPNYLLRLLNNLSYLEKEINTIFSIVLLSVYIQKSSSLMLFLILLR